ncbi:MAG: hypothetical protein V9G20_28725 [Candidatus Promineifilaceae bacterium]
MTLLPEQVINTRTINTNPSYGLTLVLGLPLPAALDEQIQQMHDELEGIAPGQFGWYAPYHRHITVIAPLRGRYRTHPPLQMNELPLPLAPFVQALNDCFSQLPRLVLQPVGAHLGNNGMVSVQFAGGEQIKPHISRFLSVFPELDPPKRQNYDPGLLHHTTGYLTALPTVAQQEKIAACLAQRQFTGVMPVATIWLVHYANRTLRQVVGRLPFQLQQVNEVTAATFLAQLHIRAGEGEV